MSTPTFLQVDRSVADLVTNTINPRTLKDKAFKELKESLDKDREFIKARPIIVSMAEGRENTVIAGNMRLQAIKSLGWATVPVVEVRDASVEQEKEWMVKDNLHKGEWDFEKLADNFELDFLKEMGFDEKGLNKVLAGMDNSADDEFDADKELESIAEPVVKRGEIWQLGEHRLMCGDSTKKEDVERMMDGKKADMVFTDPPYGVSYQSNMRTKSAKFDVIENDDKFVVGWIPLVASVSNGYIFIWTSWKVVARWIEETRILGDMTNILVWNKGGGGMGDLKSSFLTDYEMALVWNRGTELKGKRIGSVWSVGKDGSSSYEHPTQKPVGLAETAIASTTETGAVVIDAFLGSGSTLIACENTGRVCYGMEIDPKYCDVIIRRWEEKTGKKAVKM